MRDPVTFASVANLGMVFALLSAFVFGGSDFMGAMASRKRDELHVLLIVDSVGVVSMLVLSLLWGEHIPTWRNAFWAGLGGLFGAAGLLVFYSAMKEGSPAIVSPLAGVIGAGVPVLFSSWLTGLPSVWVLAGFACALAAIWLVTQGNGPGTTQSAKVILFAILAGLGFGLFFIAMGQVKTTAVFMPLVVAKGVGLTAGLVALAVRKMPLPALRVPGTFLAASGGFFDALANAFYVLAAQYTRMDTAVVITSLYPAFTVILASLILKEKLGFKQWIGVALCLTAIVLIAKG